ncbi:hypothetical protein [Streptomyces demainii]|uniref:Uncharacterized protein n=1 Tax=Streptomyces demainii TaxID=588122 RepID=A0ABT9L700_9ACTN|nr:hypothetical protein [Streptomyces demainii]MDP9616463.1 hypothetical protein [Streptomyces demainii]
MNPYSSVFHPDGEEMPPHAQYGRDEQLLADSTFPLGGLLKKPAQEAEKPEQRRFSVQPPALRRRRFPG